MYKNPNKIEYQSPRGIIKTGANRRKPKGGKSCRGYTKLYMQGMYKRVFVGSIK